MTSSSLGEGLHQQSKKLPSKLPEEASAPAACATGQWHQPLLYIEWSEEEWQEFALTQFMRDADDVEYSFSDAQEIFQP